MAEQITMRTRFLPHLCNQEIEDYLDRNDIIFVPVGVVEMHGIFPTDIETVIPTMIGKRLAEEADGLVLTNLQYFYAGATEIGRGTVQVSIRSGIDYLHAIAHSLLKKGFKRQVYLSFHGPANLTINPVMRDFFDETNVPILHLDLTRYFMKFMTSVTEMYSIFYGALGMAGRLSDAPLRSEFPARPLNPNSFTGADFQTSYLPGQYGFYFDDKSDHSGYVPQAETVEERQAFADKGIACIEEAVQAININQVIDRLRTLEGRMQNEVMDKFGDWL